MTQRIFEHLPYERAWCVTTYQHMCVLTIFGYTPYVHFGLCKSNYNIYLHIITKQTSNVNRTHEGFAQVCDKVQQ